MNGEFLAAAAAKGFGFPPAGFEGELKKTARGNGCQSTCFRGGWERRERVLLLD